jgi:metallophosphoesterase superfamily enzyme
MSDQQYKRKQIKVYTQLLEEPFLLTHHPVEELNGSYNLAGHMHPGVQLVGKGRQAETLPCFYFGVTQGFIPAFGMFTGLARLRPRKEDQVYVIAGQRVWNVV